MKSYGEIIGWKSFQLYVSHLDRELWWVKNTFFTGHPRQSTAVKSLPKPAQNLNISCSFVSHILENSYRFLILVLDTCFETYALLLYLATRPMRRESLLLCISLLPLSSRSRHWHVPPEVRMRLVLWMRVTFTKRSCVCNLRGLPPHIGGLY